MTTSSEKDCERKYFNVDFDYFINNANAHKFEDHIA